MGRQVPRVAGGDAPFASKGHRRSRKHLTVRGDRDDLPRDKFAAVFQRRGRRLGKSSAAGNLHSDNGDAFYVVFADDCRQLLGIIHPIQLRATHKRDVSLNEPLVESGIGVSCAVGSNKQLCTWAGVAVAPDGSVCCMVFIRVPGQPP